MEIAYTDNAKAHLLFWKKSGNKTIQTKVAQLIEDILKTPFSGFGKPEQLKHACLVNGADEFQKKIG